MQGSIDSKGDGLKRSVTFSILRAYVELSKSGGKAEGATETHQGRYLLLFEEPELYLYPKAQQLLFDALQTFSQQHAVMLTTHSPLFFGPSATATFVKLKKKSDPALATKPFAAAHPIDLGDVAAKDQFQLICHENNNIAFFSDTVVLVEGDSDLVLFPHIARTLNPDWDCAKTAVSMARIGGKASIRRYKQFFSRFDIRVAVIADLDLILKDFDQLDVPDALKEKRNRLIKAIDDYASDAGPVPEPTGPAISNARKSGSLRDLWRRAREARAKLDTGEIKWEEFQSAIDEFFAWERQDIRLEVLKFVTDPELLNLKREVLAELRAHDVFILERGDIESYYPDTVTGRDKPSKAQAFCIKVVTKEDVLAICPVVGVDELAEPQHEFSVIFSAIFSA